MASSAEINSGGDDPAFVDVTPMMSVGGGPGGSIHQAIHESLTIAALINGGLGVASGTTLHNASNSDWEYIRGSVWNDDPDCLLFADNANSNNTYSLGLAWLAAYRKGAKQWRNGDSDRYRNPTGRSHYGDLQFLHCMASADGELPTETKRKVMVWLEVMYKLVTDEDDVTGESTIRSTKLTEFWPSASLPPANLSLRYLLAKDSSFKGMNPKSRALGSMFHIIQDSYAIGHTRRTLLNPEDKLSDQPLRFKEGTTDHWGAIENFHTYGGQNTDAHSHFDHSGEKIPAPDNLADLSQWNGLLGCRDAVEKCLDLVRMKLGGNKWEDGVRAFFEEQVLALSPNASPANSQVW